jgi:dienelactone hydrolase
VRLALALAFVLVHASAASASVLVVGDSLVVGTAPYLPGHVTSDGRVGRPSTEAVSVLRAKFSGQDVVVFDAGVNDDPAQPSRLSTDLAAARSITGSSCLVVSTMSRPPYNGVSVDGLNRAVRSFAASTPNVQLVDWRGAAVANPRLMNSDGVHPTPAGYQLRARLFERAIAGCGSRAEPAPAPPGPTPRTPRHRPKPPPPPPEPAKPRKPKRKPPPPELGNESPVILDEPVSHGELISPAGKGAHPAVVMLAGTREQAEFLAEHGVAALINVDDAKAAISLLRARTDIKAIGLWAFGEAATAAAGVAANNPQVKAIVVVSPSPLTKASREDWQVRNALGTDVGTASVTRYYSLTSDLDPDATADWRGVSQPVLAVWGSADRLIPIHDSAVALASALKTTEFHTFPGASHELGVESEGNRLGSAPGFKELEAQWLRDHLDGTPAPRRSTPLPPKGDVVAQPVSASLLERWPVQLAWLLIPAIALVVRRPPWPRFAAIAGADLLALGAIAIAVTSIVDDRGQRVSTIAGIPTVLVIAWVLTLAAVATTAFLARRLTTRVASGAWLLLALFWLV